MGIQVGLGGQGTIKRGRGGTAGGKAQEKRTMKVRAAPYRKRGQWNTQYVAVRQIGQGNKLKNVVEKEGKQQEINLSQAQKGRFFYLTGECYGKLPSRKDITSAEPQGGARNFRKQRTKESRSFPGTLKRACRFTNRLGKGRDRQAHPNL